MAPTGGDDRGDESNEVKARRIVRSLFRNVRLIVEPAEKTQLPTQNSKELPASAFENVVLGNSSQPLITVKFHSVMA